MTYQHIIDQKVDHSIIPYKPVTIKNPSGGDDIIRDDQYQDCYCDVALHILSEPGNNIYTLSTQLGYTKATIYDWARKYPKFKVAVQQGMEMGKVAYMRKMYDAAWVPSRDVNTVLIRVLGKHLYGIDDTPQIADTPGANGSGGLLAEGETSRLYLDLLPAE